MPAADLLDVNPDHHLWRNGRFWWVAFTLIHDGWRQERVRRSLKTADVIEARRRRDAIFAQYAAAERAELSLRFVPAPQAAAA
jgi:hypothetical protein